MFFVIGGCKGNFFSKEEMVILKNQIQHFYSMEEELMKSQILTNNKRISDSILSEIYSELEYYNDYSLVLFLGNYNCHFCLEKTAECLNNKISGIQENIIIPDL